MSIDRVISILIYDLELNLLGIISNPESLIINREFQNYGSFEMTISNDKANVDKLIEDRILVINKDYDNPLYINNYVINSAGTDEKILDKKSKKITGYNLNYITTFRVIVPPLSTSAYDTIDSTNIESIMKHYVTNCFINPTYDGVVQDERKITNMIVATNQNRGVSTVYKARYELLSDVLYKICKTFGCGYRISIDITNKKFIFDYIESIDKTSTITFCKERANYLNTAYQKNTINYKNIGYVLGSGTDEERIITVVKEDDIEHNGLLRREKVYEQSSISDITDLQSKGNELLADNKILITEDGKIYDTEKLKYKTNYDLGDIVKVDNIDRKITKIQEVYERGKIEFNVTFGDSQPDLSSIFYDLTRKEIK